MNPPPPPAGTPPCLAPHAQGCVLHLAVVPGAKRTGADGLHDGCLRVRLAAPPVDGKANAALLAWLGDELHLPRRAVTLLRGETARRKQVLLAAAPETIATWLNHVLAGKV